VLIALAAAGAAGVLAAAWGWFEAGWLRTRVLDVELPGLPPELDGLRIAHLSDFHLGAPSRGRRAVERAVEWTAKRKPDLVLVSGDLLSRPSGEPLLRALLARLEPCVCVLGNHDFAMSRDPFSKPVRLTELGPARLLFDEAVELELRGRRVQVVGVDPRSYTGGRAQPEALADRTADLRVLLCHFPGIARKLPAGSFDLVLAGDTHGGQIALPYPGGKLGLAHPRVRELAGLVRHTGGALHVSPGLGTTFVPFRFFARPEATELVLHSV
jgi:predicted MPP superfamily phosphohydrolase